MGCWVPGGGGGGRHTAPPPPPKVGPSCSKEPWSARRPHLTELTQPDDLPVLTSAVPARPYPVPPRPPPPDPRAPPHSGAGRSRLSLIPPTLGPVVVCGVQQQALAGQGTHAVPADQRRERRRVRDVALEAGVRGQAVGVCRARLRNAGGQDRVEAQRYAAVEDGGDRDGDRVGGVPGLRGACAAEMTGGWERRWGASTGGGGGLQCTSRPQPPRRGRGGGVLRGGGQASRVNPPPPRGDKG